MKKLGQVRCDSTASNATFSTQNHSHKSEKNILLGQKKSKNCGHRASESISLGSEPRPTPLWLYNFAWEGIPFDWKWAQGSSLE